MLASRNGNGNLVPSNPAPAVTFADGTGKSVDGCAAEYRADLGAVLATVPVSLAEGGTLVITLSVGGAVNGVNRVNGVNGIH